jgi:hypothetical protein
VSLWVDVGNSHVIQLLADGYILWEHDTLPGYKEPRHRVASREKNTWTVVQADPVTLQPSLHCDPKLGGCGAHGFITNGQWTGV